MIYHLTEHSTWQRALQVGEYRPVAFKQDGFIHCCTAEQLPGVLARHFAHAEELVLLHIVERRIKAMLRYEGVDGVRFPHLYGPLPLMAIEDVSILTRTAAHGWDFEGIQLLPAKQVR